MVQVAVMACSIALFRVSEVKEVKEVQEIKELEEQTAELLLPRPLCSWPHLRSLASSTCFTSSLNHFRHPEIGRLRIGRLLQDFRRDVAWSHHVFSQRGVGGLI